MNSLILQDYNNIEEAVEILKIKGFSAATLQEFGIFFMPSNYKCKTDLMWERLSLPIHGFNGRIIAHAGRRLDSRIPQLSKSMQDKYMSEELANAKINKWLKSKWINEPYEKRRNLFNIHRAYNSIIQNRYCIVVEGYWDVMALYNKGVYNVVATCGVSFTQFHAYFIKALCDHCIFIYDPDIAGETAADASFEFLNSINMSSTIIELPNNMDPDEYVKNKKSESLIKTFNSIFEGKKYKICLN